MRTLHVAALAFPTPQGTQAALHAMLQALAEAGHDTHLLCYDAAAFSRATPYQVYRAHSSHRLRSLRSGPSLDKLRLDLSLLLRLRELTHRLAPDLIVAHHVEAAACALALNPQRWLFMAHTSLAHELPSYGPTGAAWSLSGAGYMLDRVLCRQAPRTLAVSPLLARILSRTSGRDVAPIAVPWSLPDPITPAERRQSRAQLGIAATARVALYAGNLDAYQGLDTLAAGLAQLARVDPDFTWLVATESPREDLLHAATRLGMAGRLVLTRLTEEADRRLAHAAADVAVVPRGAAGGLPIKLLDALARGVPVVATRRACAGLEPPVTCIDDSGSSWCAAVATALNASAAGMSELARAYVQRRHAPAHFVSELIAHAPP